MRTNFDDLRIFVDDHLVANGLPPTLDEIIPLAQVAAGESAVLGSAESLLAAAHP